jgi:hypothetical protein
MKYIKTFELYTESITGQFLDYNVGDIVISIEDHFIHHNKILKKGNKYEVLRIYKIPEDKFLNNLYMRVDVKELDTNMILKGWKSTYFKSDVEFDSDKYNL